MRYLGIDHGLKRLGVAISDAGGMIARELTIITRKSKQEDFDALAAIVAHEGVSCVVVGVPYSLDAPEGVHTQADTVRLWIARLREAIATPVIEWDEQLTSDDARELAKAQRRKPTAPIDDLAARIILQSYLDALHDGLA